jgi:RNA polymerase sigma factor (sigma-70 family)
MVVEPAIPDKTVEVNRGAGDSRFCQVFERYQPALRRLVSAYVANPADREDLLQDIAVGIWESLPRFRDDSSERTWICRIAHNIAIRLSTKVRKRSTREPSIEASLDPWSAESSAEDLVLINERRKAMMDGLQELPVLDRQLITLHLEGLSALEIEEVTGFRRERSQPGLRGFGRGLQNGWKAKDIDYG